ncbi:hypothetical protein [Nonomuraea insulae]|uniref:Small secreted hydrophilic protein n=1 Tax=Nonomuraea insulae TaxID=1616787 RepID=A0ABW1DBL9_9ACTN
MKHRGMVIILVLGLAAAGFMSVQLVRAADEGPDLGGPVVVSRSPAASTSSMGRSAEPSPRAGSTGKSAEPGEGERPAPRKTKAEPVKPPSPRPGGGDDDDDGGGDDDDDDD